jgi:hypothetical protein
VARHNRLDSIFIWPTSTVFVLLDAKRMRQCFSHMSRCSMQPLFASEAGVPPLMLGLKPCLQRLWPSGQPRLGVLLEPAWRSSPVPAACGQPRGLRLAMRPWGRMGCASSASIRDGNTCPANLPEHLRKKLACHLDKRFRAVVVFGAIALQDQR